MIRAAILLLCSSCAAWSAAERKAWVENGACSVVCDYNMGYMSTALTKGPFACQCFAPELEYENSQHLLPVVDSRAVVFCCGGCAEQANEILRRQPWRRPKGYPDLPNPLDPL